MLRYKQIDQCFFTDTFEAKKKHISTRGYRYCQLFVSDKGFVYVVFMRTKGEFINALELFAKEVGVPTQGLVSDPSGQGSSEICKRMPNEAEAFGRKYSTCKSC